MSEQGIICPRCSAVSSQVIDSRQHELGRRRRHECSCGFRFTTIEMILPNTRPNVSLGKSFNSTIVNREKVKFAKRLLDEASHESKIDEVMK